MLQKGIYPYDLPLLRTALTSLIKQNCQRKKQFYSTLNDEHIANEQYQHVQNVWKKFKLKDEYHDLYLISDILLSADVFENFRKSCLQYYKLDQCHYFTRPGLSWDVTIKITELN